MTNEELIALRKRLGLTQVEMADRMGLSTRALQVIEAGESLRGLHVAAAERVALAVAVERGDPMLAPVTIRREALELARMVTG
ncbi:helix-turn-helix domain-containing protein [Methylosinus sporium]|uniref:Transcriptional regulator n=1 Tax=Methylosinus sporium TaxID=428 RepID=A0A2U1SSQ0_METSR|nr:helix-turn-helix transcriptional regulator [Methylosinus sporium]PWB94641.1 transcriptional regulator [Methylosinus sporium]